MKTIAMGLFITNAALGHAQTVATGPRTDRTTLSTVSVDVVDVPLASVLNAIVQQAGLRQSWDVRLIDRATRVTLHMKDVPADIAFAKALSGTGMQAIVAAGRVDIVKDVASTLVAQGSIAGQVIDARTRQGVRRAAITLDENTKGIMSGDDGKFYIPTVSPGTHTVVVKSLGYTRVAQTVSVNDGATQTLVVALQPSAMTLDQVVVTGTVIPTELKAVPNAITVITAKDIEARGITQIDQLFRGDVPGLFVANQGADNPLDTVSMFSRGATKLPLSLGVPSYSTNAIKTFVDGIELANPSLLNQIDPRSIERIEILDGPQASTIYGSNAINGVMQIFTKRGSTTRPEVRAAFLVSMLQNNFSSSLAPANDHSVDVSGVEGHQSYNAGGSWLHVGAWSPSKQTTTLSGYGGTRLVYGPFSADASVRLDKHTNVSHGSTSQVITYNREQGLYAPAATAGIMLHGQGWTTGQTLGLRASYSPWSWWSHDATLGSDGASINTITTAPTYARASDTTLSIDQTDFSRQTLQYVTTLRAPLGALATATITSGLDGWQYRTMHTNVGGLTTLTGTLNSSGATISRYREHNAGTFLQTQFGIADALFLTYGVRAEWNPNYGADALPNIAPRYGVALTHEFGPITAKLRGSYGRSTRPPSVNAINGNYVSTGNSAYVPYYYSLLPNPNLTPELQRGGEGGIELYAGSRISLVVTRYNQTVDDLILQVFVDSLRSNIPTTYTCGSIPLDANGYGYLCQSQNANVGNIRNDGWEMQSTFGLGPIDVRGVYSFTKSRFLGVTSKYQQQFVGTPQYAPGSSFQQIPEHTWSWSARYSSGTTSLMLTVNGLSQFLTASNQINLIASSSYRLQQDQFRMTVPSSNRVVTPGYSTATLSASQRLASWAEGVLYIDNLMNSYHNDLSLTTAVLGRQTKMGLRLTWR